MTQDDLLYRFRRRTFAMAAELAPCRAMGIHPHLLRWKRQLDRYGPEILRPRERRVLQMANQISVLVEQRVVAFALGHPGFGPARIAAELAQPRWGAIRLSTNGCGGSCSATASALGPSAMAGGRLRGPTTAAAPGRGSPWPAGPARLLLYRAAVRDQGNRVAVHRLDVASDDIWATLQVTRRNPSAHWTSALACTVAADLASRGWKLERVMSDNAQEFRSATFAHPISGLGARHSFIRAGRPRTNGCVERAQQTILEECWKPAFARYLIPKQTGLKLDLERYLRYYDTERAPSAAGPRVGPPKPSSERPNCGKKR